MVKIKKELTHIYHEYQPTTDIAIGSATGTVAKHLELFEKSLVLTSDLKRLPYLLGGSLKFIVHPHIYTAMIASGLSGITVNSVLLNGYYEASDFATVFELFDNEKANSDILLFNSMTGGQNTTDHFAYLDLQASHWDFEGAKILYDTLTLMIFIQANTNVATADFTKNVDTVMEIEIDWQPLSKPELMEFIMEHIYARQGD